LRWLKDFEKHAPEMKVTRRQQTAQDREEGASAIMEAKTLRLPSSQGVRTKSLIPDTAIHLWSGNGQVEDVTGDTVRNKHLNTTTLGH
jgi:hypothetical protein